jgi:hypothetical protein
MVAGVSGEELLKEDIMLRKLGLTLVLIGLAGAACTKSSGSTATSPSTPPASAGSPTSTAIVQASFVDKVDNEWFPLVPGTTLTYKGTKDDEPAVDVFEITGETKVIDGVKCVVVRDTLTLGGKLHERTEDWYVQDRQGNVWYFGEDTKEYNEKGKVVSTSGTWQAGVDGAQPGIFMPADPQSGQSFQQEFYTGQAEDHFVVLHTLGSARVPYGSFKNTLATAEWTPLEPDVLTEKFYVKGIGQVKEIDVTGSNEHTELVSVRKS